MNSNRFLKVLTAVLVLALIGVCVYAAGKPDAGDPSVKIYDDKYVENIIKRDVKMQFHEDGTFKIVQFSDLHSDIKKAPGYIKKVVDKEHPDLVLITGDVELFKDLPGLKKYIETTFSYLYDNKIPWAHVYGNHDIEFAGAESISELKRKVQSIYESYPYNVSKTGPKELSGGSNYVFPIYKSNGKDFAAMIWGLDSNMYLENNYKEMPGEIIMPNPTNGGFKWDYIKPDQVMWYYNTSEAIERYAGRKVPGLMFFHIPLPEMNYIANNPEQTGMVGKKREPVNCSEVNSGLFAFLLGRRDVCAVFNGHDHINDYTGTYAGIRMSYTPCITHQEYHDKRVMGARVIELKEDDIKNFRTRIVYLLKEGFYDDSLDRDEPVELSDEVLKEFGEVKHETANIPTLLNEPGLLTSFNTFAPVQIDDLSRVGEGANLGTVYSDGIDIPKEQFPLAKAVANGYNSGGVGIYKNEGKDYALISLYVPEKEYKGEEYLRMYVDFTGMDWNMGNFGLINKEGAVFQSKFNTGQKYMGFFYLPDGDTKWQYYTHSNQGKIGATQGISLYNFKGWIAVRVKDSIAKTGPATNPQMDRNGTSLREGDIIRGLVLRYNLLHDSMVKKTFTIDEPTLTNEYWVFH